MTSPLSIGECCLQLPSNLPRPPPYPTIKSGLPTSSTLFPKVTCSSRVVVDAIHIRGHAIIAHAMRVDLLPASIIEAIGKRRWLCFWIGEQTNHGAMQSCLDGCLYTYEAGGALFSSTKFRTPRQITLQASLKVLAPWACWFRRGTGGLLAMIWGPSPPSYSHLERYCCQPRLLKV
jgi:hypothetical protein